jgi:hypothetical protein
MATKPPNLPGEPHASLREHSTPDFLTKAFQISCRGISIIDQKIAVFLGYGRATTAQISTASVINQTPGSILGGIDEGTTTSALTSRLTL